MGKFFIAVAVIVGTCIGSWVGNIISLTRCDFKAPYKAEIIRGVGIPVAPVGIVVGFISNKNLGETK